MDQEDLTKRTTPLGLLNLAQEFYKSFEIIITAEPKSTTLMKVKYYLICHCLELVIKAYLRSKDYTYKRLKDSFGHDIYLLVWEAKNVFNYNIGKTEMGIISSVSHYYVDKKFEYFQVGYSSHAHIIQLQETVKRILDDLTIIIEIEELSKRKMNK